MQCPIDMQTFFQHKWYKSTFLEQPIHTVDMFPHFSTAFLCESWKRSQTRTACIGPGCVFQERIRIDVFWMEGDLGPTSVSENFLSGFFPVSYEEVPCNTASQGPVVGVLQYDPWLCEVKKVPVEWRNRELKSAVVFKWIMSDEGCLLTGRFHSSQLGVRFLHSNLGCFSVTLLYKFDQWALFSEWLWVADQLNRLPSR